jgi:hypothetical protein
MTPRQLVLLSPYRLPTHYPLTLADEDMACWLNAYSALWHPAALRLAAAPLRIDSGYDHETPRPGHLYAVPEAPSSLLPEDWPDRVRAAGALVFRATADRTSTFANLLAALAAEQTPVFPDDVVASFLGVGMGHLLLTALSDAMEHENLLEKSEFWNDIQQAAAAAPQKEAAAQPPTYLTHLQPAAARLLAARERLYPVTIHLLDLLLLEEQQLADPWPVTVSHGIPVNVIASSVVLEMLQQENPQALTSLAEAIQTGLAEVCGGGYLEREEALLPVESQLWNLAKGQALAKTLLGNPVGVYGRRRFGAFPLLPALLHQQGISRAVILPMDDAGLPAYSSPVVTWTTQDGPQVDCFVRKPLSTSSIDAFFNLGHYLYKTTREDHTATLAFIHGKAPALPWYADLLALSRLAPVAGQWSTLTRYFSATTAGEHAGTLEADNFHFDYLTERIPGTPAAQPIGQAASFQAHAYPSQFPVSGFAQHVRLRRRIDTCWTLAALQRGLAGRGDAHRPEKALQELEDQVEKAGTDALPQATLDSLATQEQHIAGQLAERLVARAASAQPGYIILNPCSFTRRLALELPSRGVPIPVVDPVKAMQVDGNTCRVVAEVPPLGFAWFPQAGPPGTPPPASRMRLADERCVRNEFFEAEIDTASGGLRAIRDHKTSINRLGQRLIFRPGSTMKASQVKTTSSGPALGEIVSEGVLLADQGQELARFRQRFRAWLGRPILDMRIEIYPEQPPAGDPWHAYFGAQFAWRDEQALLLRGLGGLSHVSTHVRPQTPDFLEIRLPRHSTTLFPGGLPFHQRDGGRMVDIILVPPGETATAFDLAIGLDREQPMQTALGLVTPATVVPTAKGPPHVGAKGWLFHLDAPNLMLTTLRPGGLERSADGSGQLEMVDAVTARLLECSGFQTSAELRCVRNPFRVALLDARGHLIMEGSKSGDAALFQVGSGGLLQVQVQFS